MKVTFDLPASLELTAAQIGELITAKAARNPAHSITFEDGGRLVIDASLLPAVAWIPDVPPEEAQPEAPAEETQPETDTRTKAELQEALEGAGIEYDKSALKADLQQLVTDNKL